MPPDQRRLLECDDAWGALRGKGVAGLLEGIPLRIDPNLCYPRDVFGTHAMRVAAGGFTVEVDGFGISTIAITIGRGSLITTIGRGSIVTISRQNLITSTSGWGFHLIAGLAWGFIYGWQPKFGTQVLLW
jgi:hypothetical protein